MEDTSKRQWYYLFKIASTISPSPFSFWKNLEHPFLGGIEKVQPPLIKEGFKYTYIYNWQTCLAKGGCAFHNSTKK